MVYVSEYGSLREKIAAESVARKAKYAGFEAARSKASEAGKSGRRSQVPSPDAVVQERAGPFGGPVIQGVA